MRNFTLIVFAVTFFVTGAFSQNFVNTTAENRNVILEEFTGIYCTYCPDGHKRAAELAANNPGDVFLINVHTGGYAAPTGNDPDFRTPFGASLASQSGLTGYPSGTVNRRVFPGNTGTATSRGDWATNAASVINETSSVNVAAQATIDYQSRELKVVVETYYTSNAAASSHKLNVALTQDNIEGPQTGGANFYPAQILPNGNYNHKHMLRHLLTGQWGASINTTTMGHFQADTFTYTLPADINNIPLEIANLNVVVFVSEGQQNILSGNAASMSIVLPAGATQGDLAVANDATAPAGYCNPSYTPKVTVSNPGTMAIDTFEVKYSVNGGTPVTQLITTPLAVGQSTTITFPAITLTTESTISYEVEIEDVNTNLFEFISANNKASDGSYIVLNANVDNGTSMLEGFQNGSIGDESFAGSVASNPDGIRSYLVNSGVSNTVTWNLGAHGNSDGCYRWDFPLIDAGLSSMLIFEEVDFSNAANASLTFSHAHAQQSNENDELEVLVSTDCGITWTSVFSKVGSNLSTVNPVSGSRFYPKVNEWTDNSVDLTAYAGQSDIVVAFKGISDAGNALYVDDINISSIFVGTENVIALENVKVFPNPTTTAKGLNVEITVTDTENMDITVINSLGQVVEVLNTTALNAGQHNFAVNTNNLAPGMYYVSFASNGQVTTERFVIVE
ncbi:MAG: Omp28-related outer membrane protein [Saprospiraceae bacterium]